MAIPRYRILISRCNNFDCLERIIVGNAKNFPDIRIYGYYCHITDKYIMLHEV